MSIFSSMGIMEDSPTKTSSFAQLGLSVPLLETLDRLKFTNPTPIQVECIPPGIEGRDIIGIAPTGSGKTAAFALPVLHHLWEKPQGLFACVLAPTRELAHQISSQFEVLGATMGVRTVVVVGDDDRVKQAVALAKKPHIIVATPGRLLDHLKATKGFTLRSIKFMILDEADRLLDSDFGVVIDAILKAVPVERTTYLFSATLTDKVARLQRANLRNPVKLQVSTKYSTVTSLLQYYFLCPLAKKEASLVCLLNSMSQNSAIVFVRTKATCQKLAIMLRVLGFSSVPLHGEMSQSQRLGALNRFKAEGSRILVATDLASRGLDIPSVDVVINYDCPTHSKDYIHRVGRTARAGRSGKSILMATQYDVEFIQRLEKVLDRQLDLYPQDLEEVDLLRERVAEAAILAVNQMRAEEKSTFKGSKRIRRQKQSHVDGDHQEETEGVIIPSGVKRRRGA